MDKVIVVASKNAGKIKEFKEMLEPKGYEVKSLADYPDIGEIDETGTTFSANAIIKAQAITDKYHIMAISDDSGLEIDAFDKQPGVQSARWLGHETNRSCRYVCAIAVTRPNHEPVVFEDTVECVIAKEPAGTNGFGYDPIVLYEPFGKTMAEMTNEEKNSISHRGKAVVRLEAWMEHEGL